MAVSVLVNDQQAQQTLERLRTLVAAPAAPLRQSAQSLRRLVQDTFGAQTDPWGRRWQRWAESTRRARARDTAGGSVLIRTASLYRSIDAIPSNDGIEVRADADYASYHQFGNPAHRAWGGPVRPLAQRAFLPVRAPGVADVPAAWWLEILLPVEAAIAKAAR
jgi:phage gpG-like protein